MKIRLLDIKGFGKFVNGRIAPGEGFNLVFGGNESGKSTLVEFVTSMLFGLKPGKRAKAQAGNPERPMRPWKGNVYAGALEYELDNGYRFRIERDFDRGTVHIRDGCLSDITSQFALDRETGPRFAEAHMNMTRAVFEKSVLIRQMQSAIDDGGREALLEKLANLNTAGGEDLSLNKALDALNTALLEKVGTGRSTTRPLDRVQSRLSELEEQKTRILAQNEQYLDTFLVLKEDKDKLSRLNRELAGLTGSLDAEIGGRLRDIKDECLELDKNLAAARSEMAKLESRLGNSSRYEEITELSIENLSACMYEYREAGRHLEELNAAIKGLEDENSVLMGKLVGLKPAREKVDRIEKSVSYLKNTRDEAAAGSDNGRKIMRLPSLCLIIIAAAGFAYTFLMDAGPLFAVLSGTLFLAGVLTLVFSGRGGRLPSNSGQLLQNINAEGFSGPADYMAIKQELRDTDSLAEENTNSLLEAKRAAETQKAKIETLAERIALFVDDPRIKDWSRERIECEVESFKAGYREFRDYSSGMSAMENEIRAFGEKKGLLLREASAIAKSEIRSIEELAAAVSSVSSEMTLPNHSTLFGKRSGLEEIIRKKGEEAKTAEIKIKELETRLESVPPLETLAAVEEESALLAEEKRRLENAGKSLKAAADILKDVSSGLQKNYTPALNKEMSRFVSKITDARYGSVRTDSDLMLHLEVPESEELMPVNRLSGGTIDQVYFAMRLAAVSLLENGKETLPLFLDEPFSQYDESRVKNALPLLKGDLNKRQVFFFTCRQRDLELVQSIWGDSLNIISL